MLTADGSNLERTNLHDLFETNPSAFMKNVREFQTLGHEAIEKAGLGIEEHEHFDGKLENPDAVPLNQGGMEIQVRIIGAIVRDDPCRLFLREAFGITPLPKNLKPKSKEEAKEAVT
jgi:hypothetical protein